MEGFSQGFQWLICSDLKWIIDNRSIWIELNHEQVGIWSDLQFTGETAGFKLTYAMGM